MEKKEEMGARTEADVALKGPGETSADSAVGGRKGGGYCAFACRPARSEVVQVCFQIRPVVLGSKNARKQFN